MTGILRRAAAFLLAALILPAAGCRETPKLRPLSQDATILAFGDSLTRGTGAGTGESYPARLEGITGIRVVNAGIPGETTASGRKRLGEALRKTTPDLVILCHGGNDFLRRLPRLKTEENLRAMVTAIRSAGAQVILVGVPAPGFTLQPPALYQRLAEEAQIPVAMEILPEILSDRSLKNDPVHPNSAGYERLALRLAAILRDAGGLPPKP